MVTTNKAFVKYILQKKSVEISVIRGHILSCRLYLNVGNVSNKILKEIIYKSCNEVLRIFSETDNSLIEITN